MAGRKSNKEKYIKSIFHLIEHSEDETLKDLYNCLLKEKIDAHTKNYKLLLYDSIKETISMVYDIMKKLNIDDKDHSFIIEQIIAVHNQLYWTQYREVLRKENIF